MKRFLSLFLAILLCAALLPGVDLRLAQAEDEPIENAEPATTAAASRPEQPERAEYPEVVTQPIYIGDSATDASGEPTPEMPWNDAFADYVESRFYPRPDTRKNAAGDRLDGVNRTV